jgi:hypothetical protein
MSTHPGKKRNRERAADQAVEAFSIPRELRQAATDKAHSMGMTKSGFYRYCIALGVGLDESVARNLGQFMPVARHLMQHPFSLNDGSVPYSPAAALVKHAAASHKPPHPAAAAPIAPAVAPLPAAPSRSTRKPH